MSATRLLLHVLAHQHLRQDVLTAVRADDEVWFYLHLALAPLERAFGTKLEGLSRPGLAWQHHHYDPGGFDQTCVVLRGAESLQAVLGDATVLGAARQFAMRLMRKGPCAYGRYHCPDLADRLLDPQQGTAWTPPPRPTRDMLTVFGTPGGGNQRPSFLVAVDGMWGRKE